MKKVTRKSFRRVCKTCGRSLFKISQHGNCMRCAAEKVSLANLEIKHKEGPIYEKWLKRMKQVLLSNEELLKGADDILNKYPKIK